MNDEELRRLYRRDYTREPIRSHRPQPQPQPSVIPTPIKPQAPKVQAHIAAAASIAAPAQPAHTARPVQLGTPSVPTPRVKQRAAARPKRARKKRNAGKAFAVLILLVMIGAGGALAYTKVLQKKPAAKHYFPSSITKDQIDIPVYYPVSLSPAYKVDSFKVLQKNVLYYAVTNKAGDKFYVTTQPFASNFDFTAFKKKFVKPDEYNTPIGSNLVGIAGASLIGSIQTNHSSWIILNSTAVGSINDMETITRSLQQVSL